MCSMPTGNEKLKLLITGASGQLGSELKELLVDDPSFDCFFLDRKALPLEHTALIQDVLGMYQPNVIIHTAAYTAVDKAENEPDLADRVNHLGSEEIAKYCRLHGVKLIAISTDYVFDGASSTPLSEDAPTMPINTYGLTKLKGEQAIQKWAPDSVIIRTSWVYSSYGNNFVKTMIKLMKSRDELSVVNDQVGSPTYAQDLALAIVSILLPERWVSGVYHYSNAGQASWYDFAVAIRDLAGLSCAIQGVSTADYPTVAKRPAYSLLDKTKIKAVYGVLVPAWRSSLERMLGKA
ncbi:dTDP-4-dehydrorhamnose reductase [Sphingobacterium sp. UT-1RO-CII-1]|uniref:dTDP-4-dehydrorhamnose reductase n=1 Tax=Sphingobacterium sp. UT-1RO-CII-1 TaxID=2995225 RepID=UPI00227BAD9B|nr:dTDP-4-dehydrorhamnose reductase [Sphingobacterium sp. UT-1RO-CII-1]MCY4780812.1 dTDP-4-dehydrorhamnose reductase [Sphingobacterium sp. UT-1RO-CII-1]